MGRMSKDKLLTILTDYESTITDTYDGQDSSDRGSLMSAYLGEGYGNERDGFSKVVTREVYQAIENATADIAEVFISGDELVRFEPQGPEDIEAAKQATDYTNYVFFRKNRGFAVILDDIKAGLMQRRGVIKRYWCEEDEKTTHNFEEIDQESFEVLEADNEVEITEFTEEFDELTQQAVYRGRFIRTQTKGKVVIESVPPEEFGWTAGVQRMEDAPYIRHKTKKTLSDLRSTGFDEEKLNSIKGSGDYDDLDYSPEKNAREFTTYTRIDDFNSEENKDSERFTVIEAYVRIDCDMDGFAELRKITRVGKVILDDEEVDEIPFNVWSPIRIPHKAEGLSLADAAYSSQKIKTTLIRNQLDNQYNLNNGRYKVVEGRVDLDQLLDSRPGGYVEVKDQNALLPLEQAQFGAQAYGMIDVVDGMFEKDVGTFDNSIDPNILNGNTAAGAVSQVLSKRQARIRLITRIYGEHIRNVFEGVYGLIVKYAEDAEIFRLRGDFVKVDPRTWEHRKDLSVMVGLGNGNKTESLFHMQQIAQGQQMIVAGGGLGTLITPKNIFNLQEDIVKTMDKTAQNRYFTDPGNMTGTEGQDEESVDDQIKKAELELKQQGLAIQQQKLDLEIAELKMKQEQIEAENEFKLAELNLEARQQRGVAIG